jgi:hypothetical protein
MRADSNGDSNSNQRQTSAVRQHTRTLALCMATWGYFRPEKQTIEDHRRSAATVAKTVAKPLDSDRRTWTTLEYRASLRPVTDDPGRPAHSHGSEGWGFESLRARLAQPARTTHRTSKAGGQVRHGSGQGRSLEARAAEQSPR